MVAKGEKKIVNWPVVWERSSPRGDCLTNVTQKFAGQPTRKRIYKSNENVWKQTQFTLGRANGNGRLEKGLRDRKEKSHSTLVSVVGRSKGKRATNSKKKLVSGLVVHATCRPYAARSAKDGTRVPLPYRPSLSHLSSCQARWQLDTPTFLWRLFWVRTQHMGQTKTSLWQGSPWRSNKVFPSAGDEAGRDLKSLLLFPCDESQQPYHCQRQREQRKEMTRAVVKPCRATSKQCSRASSH